MAWETQHIIPETRKTVKLLTERQTERNFEENKNTATILVAANYPTISFIISFCVRAIESQPFQFSNCIFLSEKLSIALTKREFEMCYANCYEVNWRELRIKIHFLRETKKKTDFKKRNGHTKLWTFTKINCAVCVCGNSEAEISPVHWPVVNDSFWIYYTFAPVRCAHPPQIIEKTVNVHLFSCIRHKFSIVEFGLAPPHRHRQTCHGTIHCALIRAIYMASFAWHPKMRIGRAWFRNESDCCMEIWSLSGMATSASREKRKRNLNRTHDWNDAIDLESCFLLSGSRFYPRFHSNLFDLGFHHVGRYT